MKLNTTKRIQHLAGIINETNTAILHYSKIDEEDGRRVYFCGLSSDGFDDPVTFSADWVDDDILRSASLWSEFRSDACSLRPVDFRRLTRVFG